jgi:putative toxin-antitoxin system antitoxin component (TIGR02293 family)
MVQLMGGAKALRLRAATPLALHDVVGKGLPPVAFEGLAKSLRLEHRALLAAVTVSPRTLARRQHEGTLSAEESDRLLRVARIAAQAEEALGGREPAIAWLHAQNRALGGKTPLDLVRTDAGAELVSDVLGRLEHGVFD